MKSAPDAYISCNIHPAAQKLTGYKDSREAIMKEQKHQKRLFLISGILFTALTGSALHFLYDWSGQALLAALIAPVNESVWEHLKLLFFPILLFSAAEALIRRPNPPFLPARTLGLLSGLVLIPVLFYTCTGVTGTHALWCDLLIFLAADLTVFFVSSLLEKRLPPRRAFCILSVCTLALVTLLFFRLTFFPPAIPLFQDPLTGGFGIPPVSSG